MICIREAETAADFALARQLRDHIPLNLTEGLETQRDLYGIVLLFEYDESVIGTVRVNALEDFAPAKDIVERVTVSPTRKEAACEINRLVLLPKHRGMKILRACLTALTNYIHHSTEFVNGWAVCHRTLIPVYEKFHWSVVDQLDNDLVLLHGC